MKPILRHTAKCSSGLFLLTLVLGTLVQAQEVSTSQILTLEVRELNKISVSNNAVTLTVDQASLESGSPVPAVNSDGLLFWMTNGESKKITVATNNPAPRFLLKVVAEEVANGSGVSAPEVVFNDNSTKDLVLGVSKTSGRCRVRLTASATISDGIGREIHIITYTITGG